ncbi:type II toxin-antitoxin system RatA family toxin [Streptomyces xiangluensis]|uniref:Type II toxin-antitoxin system RatA family toxin n=1 Tax=Streptomyces xiangluensis TaxID=2665720 RepID=A0ABV8YQ88_9ACTN
MPTITTRQTTGEPPGRLWAALLDCTSIPSYVPEVAEAEILHQDGDRRTTRWVVLLGPVAEVASAGPRLEWVEEDSIDHERHRVDFRQTEGPLSRCTGHWQIGTDGPLTTVELHVDFKIGIPLMDAMLGPIAERTLRGFTESALARIGERTTSGPAGIAPRSTT